MTTTNDPALQVRVSDGLDAAETRVREALATQGFGVLSEIDVEQTLRTKLGDAEADDVGPLRILGACNPTLAHRALGVTGDVAAWLPCNVVLRAVDGGTEVVAADPDVLAEVVDDALRPVAEEARRRLADALATLR